MKNKILLLITFLAFTFDSFASAGFAERFYDFQSWIYPAFYHCRIIGWVTLGVLSVMAILFRVPLYRFFTSLSRRLRSNKYVGMIAVGFLLSVPLAILTSASAAQSIMGALFVPVALMFFSIGLGSKTVRNSLMLSPIFLACSAIVCLSIVIASVLYVIFTVQGYISDGEYIYSKSICAETTSAIIKTHPYDSIKYIWEPVIIYIAYTIFLLIITAIASAVKGIAYWVKTRFMESHNF